MDYPRFARRTPWLIESQILLEPTSKALWSQLVLCNSGRSCFPRIVHVGSEGTDEDGAEEDTVAADESAFRDVSLLRANGRARAGGAYL